MRYYYYKLKNYNLNDSVVLKYSGQYPIVRNDENEIELYCVPIFLTREEDNKVSVYFVDNKIIRFYDSAVGEQKSAIYNSEIYDK